MFKSKNSVRMHDTDMAGVLYFARQFRFIHDALEEFMESYGYSFYDIFHNEDFVFVIAHCEADFLAPLKVGDKLDVHLHVENMGTSSFTLYYEIFKGKDLVGTAKTVHVTLKQSTRKKVVLPQKLRVLLEPHLITNQES